ncbi:homeodomain-interacting protein kinase 1-like isoform X2 [Syngnathus acus]|uniref:homeodomain-interacting protein kinase 1-like isoform X2 n=1 Tax=Syngnathus acus TaxID=161584 RepID=UPI001885FDC8|nr:homeodomain-interacting protein kinase 1-like isoform X2 [Syngnathus acus]
MVLRVHVLTQGNCAIIFLFLIIIKMAMGVNSKIQHSSETGDQKKKAEPFEKLQSNNLSSKTSTYLLKDVIGEGSFGKVAQCVNLDTSQTVALKVLKTKSNVISKMEIKMLEIVSVLDPVKKSIVKFIENFEHEGYTCLAFEMLDISLFDFVVKKRKKPLSVSEIRPIAHQLLTAFEALKGIQIIHADLKPDNIMLVNHSCEPFRVKLIDFGCSIQTSAVTLGMIIQPMGAPEVTLGLPFSEQVDMWGLGCALTFLHIGQHLFATNCEYQMMKSIVQIRGQPPDSLLLAGKYSQKYFTHLNFDQWKLKTPDEYKLSNGDATKTWKIRLKSLDAIRTSREDTKEVFSEFEDQNEFVSFLKCLLSIQAERRIAPGEALKHRYVSMAHLVHESHTSSYVDNAFDQMLVCPIEGFEEELISDSEDEDKASYDLILHSTCSSDGVAHMRQWSSSDSLNKTSLDDGHIEQDVLESIQTDGQIDQDVLEPVQEKHNANNMPVFVCSGCGILFRK